MKDTQLDAAQFAQAVIKASTEKQEHGLESAPIEPEEELEDDHSVCEKSLGFIPLENPIRHLCYRIAKSKLFDNMILVVIMINCVVMAVELHYQGTDTFADYNIFPPLELAFTTIFTVEFAIKVVASGFVCHRNAYLRESWNRLDFGVVLISYLSYIEGVSSLTAFRSLRVMRPLRTINTIPGMKIIIASLLSSLPYLADVLTLFMGLIFVYGILGVQLYSGRMSQKCFKISDGSQDDSGSLCSILPNVGYQCPSGWECARSIANPNLGVTSFDNILLAWITIFQIITLEGWTDIMYAVDEIDSKWNELYFITCMFLGSFFVVNLVVAVIFIRFDQMKVQVAKEQEEAKLKKKLQLAHVLQKSRSRMNLGESGDLELGSGRGLGSARSTGSESSLHIMSARTRATVPLLELDKVDEKEDETAKNKDLPEAEAVPTKVPEAKASSDQKDSNEPLLQNVAGADSTADASKTESKTESKAESKAENNRKRSKAGSSVMVWGKRRPIHSLNSFEKNLVLPLNTIATANWFLWFIVVCILLNTIVLAIDFPDIEVDYPELVKTLDIANVMLWAIFLVEATVKIIGLGPKVYFKEGFNVFDFIIVLISGIEMSIGGGALSVLRTFRLLRILKVFAMSPGLKQLMDAVMASVTDLYYFFLVFFLFLFIYTVLGMQLFKGKLVDSFGQPLGRANFDTFPWALITVFQVVTGENWNELFYVACYTTDDYVMPSLYFVSCFIMCNYILLSLFLAVMLGNFDTGKEISEVRAGFDIHGLDHAELTRRLTLSELQIKELDRKPGCCERLWGKCFDMSNSKRVDLHKLNSQVAPSRTRTRTKKRKFTAELCVSRYAFKADVRKTATYKLEYIYGSSFFIFSEKNSFRILCAKVAFAPLFEKVVFFFIVLSCVFLALESPDQTDQTLLDVLYWCDIGITIVFTVEMLLKSIAFGFVGNRDAYLHIAWNQLDFVLVSTAWLNVGLSGDTNLNVLKVFRAARSLRMVSHNEKLRLVVHSIFATFLSLGNISLIAFLFFTIFAILGVQSFKGSMWRCVHDGEVMYGVAAAQCKILGGSWVNGKRTFDNYGSAMLMLMEVATLEMWPDIMVDVVDATGPNQPPEKMANIGAAFYFMLFIFVGAFFVTGLLVGEVVDQYNRQLQLFTGVLNMTERQKYYLIAYKDIVYNGPDIKPRPWHDKGCILKLYNLVMAKWFDYFIMSCIVLNVLIMSMSFYGMSKEYTFMLFVFNMMFTWIFILEMVLKLFGLGAKGYFSDTWNRFDAFIVTVSIVTMVLAFSDTSTGGLDPSIFRIIRILRVMRILRLVKKAKGLQQLLQTLVFSFPALSNMATLLALLLFMYTIVAMSVFGELEHNMEFYNDHANFGSFVTSMVTLIRMATGESWNGIMHDILSLKPDDKAYYAAVSFFFLSFCFLSAYIILNVFVAVVLKNFEEEVMSDPEETKSPITRVDIIKFGNWWMDFSYSYYMETHKLRAFLLTIPRNSCFSVPIENLIHNGQYLRLHRLLDIPHRAADNTVHWLDVCLALVSYKLWPDADAAIRDGIDLDNEMLVGIKTQALRTYPSLKKTRKYFYNVAHWAAAYLLQKSWKRYRKRKLVNAETLKITDNGNGGGSKGGETGGNLGGDGGAGNVGGSDRNLGTLKVEKGGEKKRVLGPSRTNKLPHLEESSKLHVAKSATEREHLKKDHSRTSLQGSPMLLSRSLRPNTVETSTNNETIVAELPVGQINDKGDKGSPDLPSIGGGAEPA